MASDFVTTSVRLGLRATRVSLRLTGKLAGSAIKAAQRRSQASTTRSAAAGAAATSSASTSTSTSTPAEAASRSAPPAVNGVAAPADPPSTPLVAHDAYVKRADDGDEVVAASSDPGAQDGAGAQLELGEPWAGYGDANADAVIARIADASAAELAVLELYEQAHKARKTVLAAANKRLNWLNPPRAA